MYYLTSNETEPNFNNIKGVIMNNNISVLFYIKRTKTSVNGEVPIYMRVTVSGQRIDKSTGKFVDESKWLKSASKVKGNTEIEHGEFTEALALKDDATKW